MGDVIMSGDLNEDQFHKIAMGLHTIISIYRCVNHKEISKNNELGKILFKYIQILFIRRGILTEKALPDDNISLQGFCR